MKYGPWIIWNATPDSVCPVPKGTMGQRVRKWDSWAEAESREPYCIVDDEWSLTGDMAVVAYRILQEPKVETVTGYASFYPSSGAFNVFVSAVKSTHRMSLPLVDDEPPCGTYVGPDGHKITVEKL